MTPLIAAVESGISDPREGLPEEVFLFASRIVPLVNVDLLVQDERGRTLLTWREDEFYGGGWHIPGGIIRFKEACLDRVEVVAREELGSTIEPNPKLVDVFESITSDRNRGHFISLLYRCELSTGPSNELRADSHRPKRGQWRWFGECPPDLLPAQRHYAHLFKPGTATI